VDQDDIHFVVNGFGRRIAFDPADERGRSIEASNGDVNPMATALWRTALSLSTWDTVIDIGSNYGEMLVDADLQDVPRVIAFEPSPKVLPYLRATIADLPFGVELHEVAAGAFDNETVLFEADPRWSGTSHVTSHASDATIEVPAARVDSTLDDAGARVCVKIDVEGQEQNVLDGMAGLFAASEVVVVMFEISHMSVDEVTVMTRSWPMFLMTSDARGLVPMPRNDAMALGMLLHDGRVHRQDAIMVRGTGSGDFARTIPLVLDEHAVADGAPFAQAESLRTRLRSREATLRKIRHELDVEHVENERLRDRLRARERELRGLREFAGRRSVRAADRIGRLAHRLGRRPPRSD
jgi:FkbM family methyltransferase